MDFKDRKPQLNSWPHWVLDRQREIFPYRCLLKGSLSEFKPCDGSTTFLLYHDDISEEDQSWRGYALEAPKEWDVRCRFEHGEINWSKFFESRGWLIEVTGNWDPYSDIRCRFIEPSELSMKTQKGLAELDALGSPYQILHDHLLDIWSYKTKWGRDASEYQRRYESLIRDHGHMLKHESKVCIKPRAA